MMDRFLDVLLGILKLRYVRGEGTRKGKGSSANIEVLRVALRQAKRVVIASLAQVLPCEPGSTLEAEDLRTGSHQVGELLGM